MAMIKQKRTNKQSNAKLLSKNMQQLLLYAVIAFAITTPLFYLIIDQLYIQDVNDALLLKKEELKVRANNLHSADDIHLWLSMDDDVILTSIETNKSNLKDSIYYTQYLDSIPQEIEPYRELVTNLLINGKPYRTKIRISLMEDRDMIIGIVEAQSIVLAVLLIGWVFINQLISKKMWQPFYSIIGHLKQYEISKTPLAPIAHSGIQEFDELSDAIDELIQRNHESWFSQKKFIENVSHEMQTPLAVFQSKLDLLIGNEQMTTEQAKHLDSLYHSTQYLHHLNKSLLLLSKIENHQFDEKETINGIAVLKRVIEYYSETIEIKELSLRTGIVSECILIVNPYLFQMLLTNLVSNAIFHNRDKGAINILMNPNHITIKNTGTALSFDDKTIFKRFKKHESTTKGVGLGLAIVKEICDKYNWNITHTYNNGWHSFIIQFSQI